MEITIMFLRFSNGLRCLSFLIFSHFLKYCLPPGFFQCLFFFLFLLCHSLGFLKIFIRIIKSQVKHSLIGVIFYKILPINVIWQDLFLDQIFMTGQIKSIFLSERVKPPLCDWYVHQILTIGKNFQRKIVQGVHLWPGLLEYTFVPFKVLAKLVWNTAETSPQLGCKVWGDGSEED